MKRALAGIMASIGAAALVVGVVGAVPAADIGTWSLPTTVSAAGADVDAPQISVSADGTRATAIWQRGGYGSRAVQTASATITGNTAQWSSVVDLSTPGQDSIYPQVALSSDGTRATAMWSQKDGGTWIVRAASATISGNAATWGAPVTLSNPGESSAGGEVALSADGTRATSVWLRLSGNVIQSASGVIAGTTATWGSPVNLSSGSSLGYFDQQVGLSSDGTRATAVWAEGMLGGHIRSASATVTGTAATWGGWVNLATVDTPLDPVLGVSADGTGAVAVWRHYDGSSWRTDSAAATVSGSTGTWGSPTFLAALGYQPHVALSSDGATATAVWQGSDGSVLGVESATASVTGSSLSWGAAVRLSDAGRTASVPGVAVSADGSQVTAVWSQSDGEHNLIRTRSARISGTSAEWGPGSTVSAAGQDAGAPYVALSASGRLATAVWYRGDGTNRLLQASSALIRQTQSIDFPAIADVPLTGGPVILKATASSGLTVSFSSATPQVCTVSGDRAQLVGAGTCTINADQSGNDDYVAAISASRSFSVTGAALKAQVPKKRCHIPPKKIRRSGKTVLMRKPCRTNAGQKVTVKVTSKPRVKKSGAYKVLRRKKAVKLRTFGKAFKVRVTWKARSKPGYSAYTLVKPYRVR
jgi:hypothetical protein